MAGSMPKITPVTALASKAATMDDIVVVAGISGHAVRTPKAVRIPSVSPTEAPMLVRVTA